MSKLFLVPTPIGNLEDITFRSIRILNEVDLILAEDTRTSGKLLKHFDIKPPMQSFHMHNEHKVLDKMVDKLKLGIKIALISDAGTPGISDPGFLLVRACVEEGIETECLPGATALIPAIVQSGFPTDRFIFEGFLPRKKGRKSKLLEISQNTKTTILYESPFRVIKTLLDLKELMGSDRKIAIVREISKIYEEVFRGTVEEAILEYNERPIRGEFVICVDKAE